jgi:hypothetical protein
MNAHGTGSHPWNAAGRQANSTGVADEVPWANAFQTDWQQEKLGFMLPEQDVDAIISGEAKNTCLTTSTVSEDALVVTTKKARIAPPHVDKVATEVHDGQASPVQRNDSDHTQTGVPDCKRKMQGVVAPVTSAINTEDLPGQVPRMGQIKTIRTPPTVRMQELLSIMVQCPAWLNEWLLEHILLEQMSNPVDMSKLKLPKFPQLLSMTRQQQHQVVKHLMQNMSPQRRSLLIKLSPTNQATVLQRMYDQVWRQEATSILQSALACIQSSSGA